MSLIVKPNTFTTGATIVASENNDNFDTVYNDYNGNITNANVAAGAAIVDTKLAQITTASKVSGTSFTGLASIPSGAGSIPSANGGIPSGFIGIWSGAITAIPTGWLICDGTNSTPDLTDRFVLHADADSGGTNDVGDTGGASTHAHTIAIDTAFDSGSTSTIYGAIESSSTTNDTSTVSNVPKYYALAYIMKS